MQFSNAMRTVVLIASITFCLQGQETPPRETQLELKGIPPRATPGDYQTHVQVGDITIAAEFTGHALPTADGPINTEDYVGVEAALFGPGGKHLMISPSNFSLRLNGKKSPLPAQPWELTVNSLRDPEWAPPEPKEKQSKTSLGGGGQDSGPPRPPKVPLELQRAWAKRIREAAMPVGDRPLPQAGLLLFQHHGKTENLESVELIYDGPAGKASVKLQ